MQRIGFLLLPGLGLSSLAGALESLSAVNLLLDAPAYEPLLLSVVGGGVAASSGATLLTLPMSQVPALDAVFVVSERPWATDDPLAPVVLPWLQQQAERGIWMAGMGSGAAWLAEAGLLKGQRCTVDWSAIAALAERHEDVLVSQQLYEIEPQRLSCAGQQASVDMV
ncbi:AraC family transcriptional regulator, partial [Ideonella sp.]|uniref:AraC family transcriptional regulator n=1 Tax=Ideonella sp. TaxID=1929293 RepID=UPI003BB5BBC4